MRIQKRFIWLSIIGLIVLALFMVGCQPAPEAETESTPETAEEVQEEEEPAPAEEEESEEVEESAAEPLTVAMLLGGPAEDGGFYQTYYEALVAVDEHFGDEVETVVVEFVPFSEEGTRTIEQLIADGADMIVDAATLLDFTMEASAAHPEVAFLKTDPAFMDNEAVMYMETGRPRYLVGVAGGLLSETGKLGFIDSFPSPWGDAWLTAYAMGAQSVNPDATVTATYIGSWYDPAATRQAAEALIDSGVDYIYGTVNPDTFITVAEERGVWASGVNLPLEEFGPNAYVMTVTQSFDQRLIEEVQDLLDGTWEGGEGEYRIVTLGNGQEIHWGSNVPADVVDSVDSVYDDMVGGWTPFEGPILDSEGNTVVAEGEALTDFDFFWGLEWIGPGIIRAE